MGGIIMSNGTGDSEEIEFQEDEDQDEYLDNIEDSSIDFESEELDDDDEFEQSEYHLQCPACGDDIPVTSLDPNYVICNVCGWDSSSEDDSDWKEGISDSDNEDDEDLSDDSEDY
jgi:hypothetical protein